MRRSPTWLLHARGASCDIHDAYSITLLTLLPSLAVVSWPALLPMPSSAGRRDGRHPPVAQLGHHAVLVTDL